MTPPLLPLTPEEGARRLALLYIDQAAEARPRLEDAADVEALHDFRVALRRLRSCLRAYEEQLEGSVGPKLSRRLRRFTRATGPGRDAEVQSAWAREQAGSLTPHQRTGLAWLAARLEEARSASRDELRVEIAKDFGRLERELRAGLSVYRAEIRLDREPGGHPTFGTVAGRTLRRQAADLAERLATLAEPDQVEEAHAARIQGKRLRYLLDPLAPELETSWDVGRIIKRLKGLQEILGELHDAHVLEERLEEALREAAAARARRLLELALAPTSNLRLLRAERRRPYDAGILALARLNRERRDRLFAELERDWLDGPVAALAAELEGLGKALEG